MVENRLVLAIEAQELEAANNSETENKVRDVNKFCSNSVWGAIRYQDPSSLPQRARQQSLFHPLEARDVLCEKTAAEAGG